MDIFETSEFDYGAVLCALTIIVPLVLVLWPRVVRYCFISKPNLSEAHPLIALRAWFLTFTKSQGTSDWTGSLLFYPLMYDERKQTNGEVKALKFTCNYDSGNEFLTQNWEI